jgi:hypothetical protein
LSAREALAQEAAVAPGSLDLDQAAVDGVLDLARIAAHESGDRRNAPLLCYLVGRAGPGIDLEALVSRIGQIPSGAP